MKIGVPKEIKPQENRIGLTPDSVKILTSNGHKVLIEKLHQMYIPFQDEDFIAVRQLQKHMKKTRINDFTIYKCENSIIKLYKYHLSKKIDLLPNPTIQIDKNIA